MPRPRSPGDKYVFHMNVWEHGKDGVAYVNLVVNVKAVKALVAKALRSRRYCTKAAGGAFEIIVEHVPKRRPNEA